MLGLEEWMSMCMRKRTICTILYVGRMVVHASKHSDMIVDPWPASRTWVINEVGEVSGNIAREGLLHRSAYHLEQAGSHICPFPSEYQAWQIPKCLWKREALEQRRGTNFILKARNRRARQHSSMSWFGGWQSRQAYYNRECYIAPESTLADRNS